ncbi:MAG: hypothetical protein Kow0059_10920 [Candidatus Sumerlaeia bacterium]
MHELGVYFDRTDFWWGEIETAPGQWDWSRADAVVACLERHDVQIYPILSYGARWWKDRTAPLDESEQQQFAEYVYRTVSRFKDRVTFWSVWNEPNILPFWSPEPRAEDYAALLKRAYQAAKRADPDCRICAPVVAPLGRWDEKFVTRLYQLGCRDYFDVFDYHYYRNGPPEKVVPRELAEIRALMARYGDEDKPIWISEFGVAAPIKNKTTSYDLQASLVVRNHLVALAEGVEKLFYFDLQNWNDTPGESWDSKLGLVEAGGEKKPSFYAYQTMVRVVDHTDVLGRVAGLGDGVEGVLLRDPARRDYVLAAWTAGDNTATTITVLCEPRDVTVINYLGQTTCHPMIPPPQPGQRSRTLALPVNHHPQYIRGVLGGVYLPGAGAAFVPGLLRLSPGESRPLKFRVHPSLDVKDLTILAVDAPAGLVWDRSSQILSAGEGIRAGVYEIRARGAAVVPDFPDATPIEFTATASIEIIPALTLLLRPDLNDGQLTAQLTVINQSQLTSSGRLVLLDHDADRPDVETVLAEMAAFTVDSGASRSVEFPLDLNGLLARRRPSTWRATMGDISSRPFSVYPITYRAAGAVVDGRLDEWAGIEPVRLNRSDQLQRGAEGWTPDEVSGMVRVWVTSNTLFLAADVTDDQPFYNPHQPVEIWRGDAIELYLGFKGPTRRTVIDKTIEFQLGLAPTYADGAPIAFYFHADRRLNLARVAAEQAPAGWTLEAEIVLSELGDFTLKPGDVIGFDVAINDLDPGDWAPEGNDPGRVLMWNGTGNNWIDPSGWGMAVIVPE